LDTVKVPPESSGGDLTRADALSERPGLGRDLGKALEVGVEHGEHDEGVLGGDRDADVDPRVLLHPPVPVGAVGARVIAQGDRAPPSRSCR
jgi:hypothetical protein